MVVAVLAVEMWVWMRVMMVIARRMRMRAVRVLVRGVPLGRRGVLDMRGVLDLGRVRRRCRVIAACGQRDRDDGRADHGFFFDGGFCDIFFLSAASSSSTSLGSVRGLPALGFGVLGFGGAPRARLRCAS